MPNDLSTSQVLAEVLLSQPLSLYVTAKRNATPRWSYRLIAEQLAADTDGAVQVSGETIRQWYPETIEAAS